MEDPRCSSSSASTSKAVDTSQGTAAELLAGGFGGAVGVFVGQPLDFVKVCRRRLALLPSTPPVVPHKQMHRVLHTRAQVRLQAHTAVGPSYNGVIDCVTQTLRREGVTGFYRGATSPLLNSFLLNAVMFAAYGHGNRLIQTYGGGLSESSPMLSMFLAGSYSGFLQTFALVPADVVKCRMQVDRAAGGPGLYAGPIDCIRQVWRAEGMRGMYRGTGVTVLRDSPTMGFYFLFYEMCEAEIPKRAGLGETSTTLWAGGICGTLTWALAYPFDTVKTVSQTMPASVPESERSMVAVTRKIVAERGVSHLYRGLSACLLRAFPTNAVTFFVYKHSMELLGRLSGSSDQKAV